MNASFRVISAGAPLCPYCGNAAQLLTDSSALYRGTDYGPVWICEPCDARVGCHPGTFRPLGRLADAALRIAKQRTHRIFDPLWTDLREAYPDLRRVGAKHRNIARGRAYRWLAAQLSLAEIDCHIGLFDIAMCEQAISIIQQQQPTAATIRAWAKEQ
jgi:zinc-finger-containing domain